MGYFDLNIPYFESDRHIADKKSAKAMRLKLIIKAMELGYTGIAYNRTIKGVMSETDRCSIPLFPLSSILKLSPSISSAVKLHRDLLSVPVSAPFRQYTRLTVMVDSPAQASVLNSGNPIIKSYDVVSVMPLNQNAFDQACRTSEVDVITIDFSEKLLFRLKQPMVKAAIQRGVYFEITYSSLLSDAQARRQMISNAKLLVGWTRGKNIILTSAAPSVTEFRGPHDVVNLASLLGLSSEHAKAALSKNCRTLITNALRKKFYYKEAIKVETISSYAKPKFDDWLKWDPISSGEGDLLLDDIDKFFSASSNVSQNVKPVDFTSVKNGLPPHGLQIRDLISSRQLERKLLDAVPDFSQTRGDNAQNICQSSDTEASMAQSLPTDLLIDMENEEKNIEHMISKRVSSDTGEKRESHLANSEGLDALSGDARENVKISFVAEMNELHPESQIASSEGQDAVLGNTRIPMSIEEVKSSLDTEMLDMQPDLARLPDNNATFADSSVDADISLHDANLTSAPSENSALNTLRAEESTVPDILDEAALHEQSVDVDKIVIDMKDLSEKEPSLVSYNMGSPDNLAEIAEFRDSPVNSAYGFSVSNNSDNPTKDKNGYNAAESELLEDDQIHMASLSGRKGRTRMLQHHFLFPFKRLVTRRYPKKRKARRSD